MEEGEPSLAQNLPCCARDGRICGPAVVYHRRVDDQGPGGVPDALRSAMEPLADLSRRVAEAIRSATLSVPGGVAGSDLLIRYAEQVSAVPRLWAEPLRRIVEEQRKLAELMAAWAEQHRQLAEQLAESAEHLRRLSQEGAAIVEPILTYAARVSDVTDSWIDLVRPDDDPS
jgi:methyl-accepting chemotaxis protein